MRLLGSAVQVVVILGAIVTTMLVAGSVNVHAEARGDAWPWVAFGGLFGSLMLANVAAAVKRIGVRPAPQESGEHPEPVEIIPAD